MDDYKLKTRSIKDLVLALQEMDLDVAEQDLTHPLPHRIAILFEDFIFDLKPEKYQEIQSLRAQVAENCSTITGSTVNT